MLLAVSLWHEMTHGFVSFIAGSTFARTPPETAPAFAKPGPKEADANAVGESGDWIECKIWGGSMQMSGGIPSVNNTVRSPSLTTDSPKLNNIKSICMDFLLTSFVERKAIF